MKKSLNPNEYININTGELLNSEIENITSVNIKEVGYTVMNFTEFMSIDSIAFEYLKCIFTKEELYRIIDMTNMIDGEYNFLYDRKTGIPHNEKTLSVEIEYSIQRFKRFLQKLYKQGILYKLTGYINNVKIQKWMLNPNIARKPKRINNDCIKEFHCFNFPNSNNTNKQKIKPSKELIFEQ